MGNKLFSTSNTQLYHLTRQTISGGKGGFNMNDDFPVAQIRTRNKNLGKIVVQPVQELYQIEESEKPMWQKTMSTYVQKMNDLTADVFDILTIHWLKHAKHNDDFVTINVDDILKYRDIRSNLNGNKYRSGYKNKQREQIVTHLQILSHLYIEASMEIYGENGNPIKKILKSPAITIDYLYKEHDETEKTFLLLMGIRPGRIFRETLTHNRQAALLPQKVLNYDYIKYSYEKRLGRYLSYMWRIRYKNGSYCDPFFIQTLLDVMKITSKRPHVIKDRLERTLDRLVQDQIIRSWQYESCPESTVGTHGWFKTYVKHKVIIEPPEEVTQYYKKINNPHHKHKQTNRKTDTLIDQIKDKRKRLGLSMSQASEQIGINVGTLSRIESGKSKPRGQTRKKLEIWCNR